MLLLPIVGSVVFVNGCSTPTQQISAFGAACGSIGSDAQKGYEIVDASIEKKNIYDIALNPTIVDSSSPIFSQKIMDERDRLAQRTKMLGELTDYAQALQQLANKNFQTSIDSSSKDLSGALKSLNGDYKKATGNDSGLSDNDIYILSTVVDAAGSAYLEWKRREYIKAIVIKADPAVQKVTALLTHEFADISKVVGNQLNIVETDYEEAFKTESAGMPFEARVQMLQNIEVAHENYINDQKFYDSLAQAVAKIGVTHAKLKSSLEQNKWTSKEMYEQAQELVSWAKTVKSFYQSLKK